ncbi:MAG TPA: hypothetical protein VNN77_11860 [candidate division Zixibacteria bacterium]|nr:hypothetical protein [candidate division Zixibacteria bacterium]
MIESWTVWLSIFGASTTAAALGAYFALRARARELDRRVVLLERELALSREREAYNQRKLEELAESVLAARRSAEEELRRFKIRIDGLFAILEGERRPTPGAPIGLS